MRLSNPLSQNVKLCGNCDLEGFGNGGQVTILRKGRKYFAFIGHMKGMGTSILDVTNPEKISIISQIPISENNHSHKVRVCGDLMLVNIEQLGNRRPFEAGLKIYDISNLSDPREISFFETGGKGVHKFWVDCEKRLAYISTEMEGYLEAFFMIVDFSDPKKPHEISRWWLPGQWIEGGEEPMWDIKKEICRHHHPVILGSRAYLGYWDAGFVILDISDIKHPRMVSQSDYSPPYGGAFHTALPISREILGRKWLVVFQESLRPYSMEGTKLMWMIDVTTEENPVPVATFQVPVEGFSTTEGRFGPHQPYEDLLLKDNLVYASWFGGGLRIVNINNPYRPHEVGYYIPPTPKGQTMIQTNDVFVDDRGLIYTIDRLNGGLDILEYTGPR
jgi:hypothetical protein